MSASCWICCHYIQKHFGTCMINSNCVVYGYFKCLNVLPCLFDTTETHPATNAEKIAECKIHPDVETINSYEQSSFCCEEKMTSVPANQPRLQSATVSIEPTEMTDPPEGTDDNDNTGKCTVSVSIALH